MFRGFTDMRQGRRKEDGVMRCICKPQAELSPRSSGDLDRISPPNAPIRQGRGAHQVKVSIRTVDVAYGLHDRLGELFRQKGATYPAI